MAVAVYTVGRFAQVCKEESLGGNVPRQFLGHAEKSVHVPAGQAVALLSVAVARHSGVEHYLCFGGHGPLHEAAEREGALAPDIVVGAYDDALGIYERYRRDIVVVEAVVCRKVEVEFGFDKHVAELQGVGVRAAEVGIAVGHGGGGVEYGGVEVVDTGAVYAGGIVEGEGVDVVDLPVCGGRGHNVAEVGGE